MAGMGGMPGMPGGPPPFAQGMPGTPINYHLLCYSSGLQVFEDEVVDFHLMVYLW
jgi:hypothetical protein